MDWNYYLQMGFWILVIGGTLVGLYNLFDYRD